MSRPRQEFCLIVQNAIAARARITELEAALDIRDRTLREIHARPDAFAECIRRAGRLEAALEVAETALRRIESGDEGTWNCGCPSGEVATSALAALRPETEKP